MVGLTQRYDCQDVSGIPDQWQRFNSQLGSVPGRIGEAAYGVCYDFDSEGNFDYMCGVEISGDGHDLPPELTRLPLQRQRYVVFKHRDHVASIKSTFSVIWADWFSTSGYVAASAPTLERYGPEFDPRTGLGGLEIWIAIDD